jgi:hypothetical protein
MANVLTHPNPRLADVQCSRLKFEPGDRVIVRVYRPIDSVQEKRLKRTVERWAGDQVEVLVINALEMSVNVEPAKIIS